MSGIFTSPKKIDACVLVAHLFIAALLTTLWHPPMLVAALYLFALPALYLGWRAPKHLVRDLSGALLMGPVFGFMFDQYGYFNQLWTYHDRWMALPHFFGTPLDILLWSFLWALYLEFLYEHFFEPRKSGRLSRAYLPMLLFTLWGCIWLVWHSTSFAVGDARAYLWTGLFSLWPIAASAWFSPQLMYGALLAALAGLPLNALFEWSSCAAGYWTFDARYLGLVHFFGCTLPVEELVFWVVATPLLVLCNFLLFVRPLKLT
jgi:hypothetical protein